MTVLLPQALGAGITDVGFHGQLRKSNYVLAKLHVIFFPLEKRSGTDLGYVAQANLTAPSTPSPQFPDITDVHHHAWDLVILQDLKSPLRFCLAFRACCWIPSLQADAFGVGAGDNVTGFSAQTYFISNI